MLDGENDDYLSGIGFGGKILGHMAIKPVESPLPLATFTKMVGSWARVVKSGESALVYHYARTDLWWRIKQLEENKEIWESIVGVGKWPLVLDVVANPYEEGEDVHKWLNALDVKRPLFVFGGERLISERLISIWAMLANEARSGRSVLLFSNQDLWSPKFTQYVSEYYELAQKVVITPLYKREDATQFVRYLAQKWGIKIPDLVTKETLNLCDGHIGLVKQILRLWRDEGKIPQNLLQNESIKTKLSIIWRMFNKNQQIFLRDIILGKQLTADEVDKVTIRDFLVRARWLKCEGKKWQITVPIIHDWLLKRYQLQAEIIINKDQQLMINNVVIEKQFSRQERKVMRLLIGKPGEVISREQVAEAVWGDRWEEKYSDWAIDQIVSRLRKKLLELRLGRDYLQTVRERGVIWQNN